MNGRSLTRGTQPGINQLRSEDEILPHGPEVATKRVSRELAPLYRATQGRPVK